MKKVPFLFFPLIVSSLLGGCTNQTIDSKVYMPFGQLYDSSMVSESGYSIENCTDQITHSGLSSLINKEENFALVVYEKGNDCTCFMDFEEALNKYLYSFNALLYSIESSEFDGGHEVFGIKVAKGESTLCVFEKGKLKYQRVTNGTDDEILEYKGLAKWMNERTMFSDMLYVTSSQLDSLFKGDAEFTVGFLRSSCSDCAYVEKEVLYDFNKNDNNVSYVIDCDAFEDDSFKTKYGLSEEANPDYGYGQGYVPMFIRYSPIIGESYADAILDASVYLNDEVSEVDGKYVVTNSYYTEERVPLLGFLGNEQQDAVILGMELDKSEVIVKDEKIFWSKDSAAKHHDKLLKSFLNAYVSKENLSK